MATKRSTTLPTELTLPTSKTTATTPTAATLPTQITLPTNTQRTTTAVNTQQSFYSDYNDPYELNSVADAVLNNEAIKKASEGWGIFSWVEHIPILRNIGAMIDLSYNKGLKPILAGDWKAAGINTLMNLGETLDVIANPVKGLLMEGGEGLIKGLGVGSGGRKNYDWDTGNWLADLGLEVLTDPLNWITLGGKAVISGGAKAVSKEVLSETTEKLVKETAQALVKKTGKEITEEIVQEATEKITKRLTQASTKTLVDYTTEAIQEAAEKELKKLTKAGIKTTLEAEIEKQLLRRTNQLKAIILDELAKNVDDAAKVLLKDPDSVVFKTLSKQIDEMLSSMQWDVLAKRINKTVATLYNASEKFEKFLFQSAFMTSGLGLGWKAVKPLLSVGGEFIENTIMRNMRKSKHIDANNVIDIFKYDAAKQTYSESYKMARTINAGDVSRQTDTFYRWVRNQFSIDETVLREIAQVNVKDSDTALAAMEKYIQNRYKGASLADYMAQVKKINADENGFYSKYVQYLNRLQSRITNAPSGKLTGANKGLVIGKLYTKEIRDAHTKQLENYLNIISELNKGKEPYDVLKKKIKFSADTVYSQVKFNELYIQSNLLGNPDINKFITNIATGAEGTLGAVVKNIISDPHAYAGNNTVRELAQRINDVAINAKTFEEFSNDILSTLYETIEGVNADKFRETILDVFYSFNSLKASDVVTNIDTISAEFIAKIEEALNAQYKTAIAGRTRISIPTNTRELLKDQVLKYAQTVTDTNADSLLCYPLSKTFTSDIVEFQKHIEGTFNTEEIALALYNITTTFKEAEAFKEAQTFFQRNIFEVNATLKNKYLGGGTDIVSTLYDGLHGAYQYGVRDAIDTHNMQMLFTFKEGQFYDVNLMETASDFTKTFMTNLNKLNDNLADKYLTEDVVRQLDSWLDTLYKEYQVIADKAPYTNLEFLNYINLKNLNDKQKFALLQSLNSMKNQIGETFLASHFARMQYNKHYNLVGSLLNNPKKLTQRTVLYNPQRILQDYTDIIYYRDLAKAVADYNGIADTSSQIFNGLKDFNDVLKQTQDSVSPLVQLNERHIKIANDMNNNVLRYTENKIRNLFDRDLANQILEQAEDLGAPPKLLNDLNRFYNMEPFDDMEYTDLLKAFEETDLNIQAPFAKQIEYQKQLNIATDKHSQAVLTNFLSLSPEDIQKELAFRGRLVMFGKSDFTQDKGMKAVYTQFNYKKADLEKLGVKIVEDQDMVIVYLSKGIDVNIYNGQYYLARTPITRNYKTLDYNEFGFDPHLQREFKKYNQYLENLTGHSPNTSLGDIMDTDLLETIYNGFDEKTLAQITAEAKKYGEVPQYWKGLPDAVKKDLPDLSEMTKADYFDQYLFNESILGTAASRKRVQAYTPNNMVKTVKNTMEQVGVHLKSKAEYIDGIMDSIYSISKGSYAQYADEEILEALVRSPRYRLCYLKEDPKWGVKIVEVPALNVEAIKTARKLNAVILPQSVYAKMYNVVNHRLGGSGFFKLWNRIMYLYKFGYLFNPGTIARNWIDTNLKTDMELGETARQFKRQARDYIRQFKEISEQVATMNDGLITRKGLEEFFSRNSSEFTIDYETYMMLEDFFKHGPVTDISHQPSLMDMGDGDLWRSFTNVTSRVMNWANQTEEMNRLAVYLADLDKGILKHDAWEHISKVHFDYAFKTRTEELIESVFPFSTFAIRNIEYWVETLEKHPEFMGLFRDIYTPIWNFDSLTPEQLNASYALQYQIINGNINLFDVNDTSYITRINPSIFDAISTIVNPVQAVQNKLATPIQDVFAMLTGQEEPSVDMLPIIGAIKQRIEKANKEQNILPSLITKRTTTKQKAPNSKVWRNKNLNNYYGIQNTSNPYYVLPKVRSDSRIDPLRTIGTQAFTSRMMSYPKVKVNVNVYNKVKYGYHQDVYQGIRYQLKLNINKFR